METTDQMLERVQKLYMNTLITANLLLALNDKLENTSGYKQKLRNLLRQLQPELTRMLDRDLGAVWGTAGAQNDQSLYDCMSQQEAFVKEVAHCSYADYGVLLEIVKEFNRNKQDMMDRLGISVARMGDEIKIR